MLWLLLSIGVVGSIPFLIYRNYQLEKRWRCLRYCWHSMSDYAGESGRLDGELSEQWRKVVTEQMSFMSLFGAHPLTTQGLQLYEEALTERDFPVLSAHK